ncbi:MAG: acyl-CoA dehydrogenase [Chloroflexi bacterium]|nr:acyl-CoA dehydrogenase [Chloroflexota bacterium]
MRYTFTEEDEKFRQELRVWIRNEIPVNFEKWHGVNEAGEDFEYGLKIRRKLANKGWLTMAWPKEYGGQGASYMKQVIFNEEMSYHRMPGRDGFGAKMLGPTLMVHGTEEQKKRFLPPIANGEVQWCQGYSEPDSGSDLASLKLKVEDKKDHWLVNGTKVWTSMAHKATWIFFLGRTDPDAPKHKGISFFVANIEDSGIEVQPIINMGNEHYFNQVIFNNVKIPKDSLIGELNRGWYIAATLLDFERSGVEYPSSAKRNFEEIIQFVKKNKNSSGEPLIQDPYINKTLVDLDLDIEAARLMAYEVAYLQSQGEVPSIEGSVAKILGTTLTQKIAKIGTDFSGLYGQLTDSSAPFDGKYLKQQLHVTAFTIFAGTTEIQKNIIATRGLGLPREDKLTVKK